jgi:hypothetical protein
MQEEEVIQPLQLFELPVRPAPAEAEATAAALGTIFGWMEL